MPTTLGDIGSVLLISIIVLFAVVMAIANIYFMFKHPGYALAEDVAGDFTKVSTK